MSDLIKKNEVELRELFKVDGGIKPVLEEIEKYCKNQVFDISTPSGRKDARSLAAKVSSSKVFLEEIGVSLVKPLKDAAKNVDSQRSMMKKFLDNLRDEVKKEAVEWDEREEKRKNDIIEKLLLIDSIDSKRDLSLKESDALSGCLDLLEEIKNTFDFQEFTEDANVKIEIQRNSLSEKIEKAKAEEKEKEELEQLRREKQEREDKEAREKAEKERLEREEKIREQAKIEAEKKAKEEAERVERENKEKLERIQREKEEAEKRAEQEKIRAVEEEKLRQKREQEKAELEEKRRRENVEHMRKINNEIVTCLKDIVGEEKAIEVVKAIALGNIQHVKILY